MLLINPFFLGVDGIPEYKFTIHAPRSHELKFRHGDHARDEKVSLLLASFFFFALS